MFLCIFLLFLLQDFLSSIKSEVCAFVYAFEKTKSFTLSVFSSCFFLPCMIK